MSISARRASSLACPELFILRATVYELKNFVIGDGIFYSTGCFWAT